MRIKPEADDAVDAPANPVTQNAATEAVKPKLPAVGESPMDPNAAPLPGVQPAASTPMVNNDPNAYQPPPQAQPTPSAPASAAQPGPITPPPVMPTASPIQTTSGEWTPPTASATSAPLIGTTNGGTMTPQGDSANSFRGYQTEQGGGFGGAFADKGANANLWSSMTNRDPAAMQQAIASNDPALRQAAINEYAKMLTMSDTAATGSQLIRGLSPDQQAAVQKAFVEQNPYAANQAGYDANRGTGAQNAAYADTWSNMIGDKYQKEQKTNAILGATFVPGVGSARVEGNGDVFNPQTGEKIGTINDDPAILKAKMGATGDFTMSANGQAIPTANAPVAPPPVSPLAGNWTAKNPAEQAAGLAAQGLPTPAPAQPQVAPPPIAPAPVPPAPAPTPPPPPAPTSPLTPAPVPEAAVATPQKVTPTQVQPQAPALPAVAPTGQPATASGMGNVAQTAVTPENALTNSMLSRAPGADRFKIAQDQWDAFQKATNPAYEASTRDAMRKAAAGGALGSGMLQTSLGDLAQQRQLALDTQKQNFLSQALSGNIEDQFRDLGVAQQQQGFQQGQQQQAFGNAVTQQQLQEALTNGSFQRALQQLTAGSSGNPADTALLLSQIFGGQANSAGSSLAQLLAGLGQKQTATAGQPTVSGQGLSDLLAQLFGPAASAATNVNVPVPDYTPRNP